MENTKTDKEQMLNIDRAKHMRTFHLMAKEHHEMMEKQYDEVYQKLLDEQLEDKEA
jgi:hypothetical protein